MKVRSIPDTAVNILRSMPRDFNTDGCSNAPDRLWYFGWWDFKWACEIHDWRYCSRCHDAGIMSVNYKDFADKELNWNLIAFLPWLLRGAGWIYRFMTWKYGGYSAFDSCGPEAGQFCRHNMPMPRWMEELEVAKNGYDDQSGID